MLVSIDRYWLVSISFESWCVFVSVLRRRQPLVLRRRVRMLSKKSDDITIFVRISHVALYRYVWGLLRRVRWDVRCASVVWSYCFGAPVKSRCAILCPSLACTWRHSTATCEDVLGCGSVVWSYWFGAPLTSDELSILLTVRLSRVVLYLSLKAFFFNPFSTVVPFLGDKLIGIRVNLSPKRFFLTCLAP